MQRVFWRRIKREGSGLHIIPFEIPLPKNEADFERMCAQVYGVVFNDRMPKMNGRRGQVQGGVDVFVKEPSVGRVGIQCKKYTMKPVKWEDVEDEVGKADKHKAPIKKLILATTAPNDAPLLKKVQELSDDREAKGLFPVEVEFWEDICNHIDRFPVLQDSYAPHTPGAAYHRQETSLNAIRDIVLETNATMQSVAGLPLARPDSIDRLISDQLDRTNELLKSGRFRDALDHLVVVGKDLEPFDAHQKARWYLQKGLSIWFMRLDDQESAGLFLKAFELYPDDERMAAAQVRGLMLQKRLDGARAAGESALERFPDSQQIWLALASVRLLQGQPVQMKDVPDALKQEPDTLQFVAHAELTAGNLDEAIKLSQEAANHPTAGFFIRANTLRIAAECGSRFPVGAMAGALPLRETKALDFAVSLFNPWHERLWDVQSDSVGETVAHLGYALLMLHRFPAALALAREAETHGYRSAEILRTQVTSLVELDREGELLSLAADRLTQMNPASLTIVGEAAAKDGNLALLKQTLDAALAFDPVDEETTELLAALRWDALMHAGQQDAAVREVIAAKVEVAGGIISACVAARVLNRAGQTLEADAVVQRAKTLVTPESTDAQKLMLAELLFNVGQFAEAGVLFERLVTADRVSDLHNRLLACYVRSHNRRKAKELIAGLPAEWIENDETRSLAIELGQQAADWAFLRPLVEAQLRKHPDTAGSWLFKLSVSLHSSTPAEFQNDLRSVPDLLEGPIRATTQLVGLELRYGEAERGIRRLYRMLRCNLDEPEALSAYFIAILGAPGELPLMEEKLPAVAAGTCVALVDEFGQPTRLVIDPSDVGELPKREGYSDGAAPPAAALLGAVVGQQVNLPELAFGDTRQYTVTAVQSACRHMLQVVRERANALGGLPHMKMVHVGTTGDGERDLAHMKAEVMRSSAISRQLFDVYATGGMTLSGFAECQGRSTVEAVLGWPTDGPPLFVGTGAEAERVAALELLARPDAIYVIDALTLAELVNLGLQEALGHLPKVLVSPVTKAMLEEVLRGAEEDRSVATSTEVNGELALIEHDACYHARRIEFFNAVLAAVEKYCEVQPAYGELEDEGEMPRLTDVLQNEEMEVLLLAKAVNATVLTLDGRFRFVLEVVAKVGGVWPQVLLMYCRSRNLVDPMVLASATIRQFLQNRSFVSLGSGDLTWMVLQGGAYLQQGMRRFKVHLSSDDAEFTSTVDVAFEFLARIAALRINLGAFGELFEHVVEAAMRHRKCPADFERVVTEFIIDLTASLNQSTHLYELVNIRTIQRMHLQRRYLAERLIRARDRLKVPVDNRPIAVRAVFVSSIPWLIEDKSSPVAGAATKVHLPSQIADPAQAIESSEASATSGQGGKALLVAEPEARLNRG
ncbi:PIN domain-containing protein [Cupriavidus sp. 30B13]|uniref:PIN domain-containing protein n=1 Tax=Cupriavidus sp. 30B13 TaxID=3384241 RepID=UPI003B9177B3